MVGAAHQRALVPGERPVSGLRDRHRLGVGQLLGDVAQGHADAHRHEDRRAQRGPDVVDDSADVRRDGSWRGQVLEVAQVCVEGALALAQPLRHQVGPPGQRVVEDRDLGVVDVVEADELGIDQRQRRQQL